MNFDSIKKILVDALKERGVTEYEIYYSSDRQTSVETLNKEINAFSSGESGGLCLRVLSSGKMGYAATEYMDADEMIELVDRALENAEATEKLDEVGLFAGSEKYNELPESSYSPIEAEGLREIATALADKVYAESEFVTDGSGTTALNYESVIRIVNSHGIDLHTEAGANAIVAQAVVDKNGEKQADYAVKLCSGKNDEALALAAKESAEDALAKIGAELVPSGKYDIIMTPGAMRSMLATFSSVFSAKAALEGMSLLKGKEGTKIASDKVTITDDPMREGNPFKFPFDAEGVATEKRAIIENGVLTTLLHNRETAMRMGVTTTANASKGSYSSPIGIRPYSFAIEPGEYTKEELYAKAENGILITEVKGLHAGANPVTGDFSLESAGFMIRDGKRAEAVKSFTVASNFFKLLESVAAVGNDLDIGTPLGATSFGSPSILVTDMSVAGK